ncbi:Transposase and inactivated derivatives [uncultured Eubacterium sp.]|nr:Transposase and inactivated derivatives [uncultured Eubacterium sp.]
MAFKYTEDQLNKMDKALLIELFLGLQDQMEELTKETHALNQKMQLLMEQVVLAKHHRFGRSTERMEDTTQISFMEIDGKIVFFNEAEAVSDPDMEEPEELELKKGSRRKQGKKDQDLSGLPVRWIDHYLSEQELEDEFGENGWKQLPDMISRQYCFVPAKVEIEEHHIGVYADKKDEHMVRAPHQKALLHGSLVSPSLGAAVMNGKYVNAVPLYRLEKEFERYGLAISRANMANWMIRLSEEYLSVFYDHLHRKIYDFDVIGADETPVEVNKDGRPAGSKSYIWVYRSGGISSTHHIVLYEYQKTRNASHPVRFLKAYEGICVTDGYQVYHSAEKTLEHVTIAGCWVHARRYFDKALKIIPQAVRSKSWGYLVMKQIQAIYREEGKLKDLKTEERLKQRQLVIKPLVDALFVYAKQHQVPVGIQGKLARAVIYLLNQEKYLRVFLENGEVPMDNNASERAIRGFCIGRKSWQLIDTIRGAENSAIIYSIAETAKANDLKPYEYFEHLLTEIPKHMEDTDLSFLDDLLPWSEKLPKEIKKTNKRS